MATNEGQCGFPGNLHQSSQPLPLMVQRHRHSSGECGHAESSFGSSDSVRSDRSTPPTHGKDKKTGGLFGKISGQLRKSFRRQDKKRGRSQSVVEQPHIDNLLHQQHHFDHPHHAPSSDNEHLSYTRADSSRRYGRGVFILITMFTGDLPGYNVDRKKLLQFFNMVDYTVYEAPINCTRGQLIKFLNETVENIQGHAEKFDRLVCAVLSHGLKDGLLTCKDNDGVFEEVEEATSADDQDDRARQPPPVLTAVDEIVAFFKHDKLKRLKGYPKLFLIQACQGMDVVKAAASTPLRSSNSDSDCVSGPGPATEDEELLQAPVPVEADIEICFACTNKHLSFVDDHAGSWFIGSVVRHLHDFLSMMHTADILTMVRKDVAEKRKKFLQEQEDKSGTVKRIAVQMPSSSTTLRKQFWLDHGSSMHRTQSCNFPCCRQENYVLPGGMLPHFSESQISGLPTPVSPHGHFFQGSPRHDQKQASFVFPPVYESHEQTGQSMQTPRHRKYSQQIETHYGTPPEARVYMMTYSQSHVCPAAAPSSLDKTQDLVQPPQRHWLNPGQVVVGHDTREQADIFPRRRSRDEHAHTTCLTIPEVSLTALEKDGSGETTPLAETFNAVQDEGPFASSENLQFY